MKQKTWITIIAIIILVVLFYFLTRNNRTNAPDNIGEQAAQDRANSQNSTPSSATSKNSVLVSTQTTGSSVTIDSVILESPGFVVIHERMSDGEAGKIVGTSNLLSAGTKQDLEINAPIKAGMTYIAMLHKDNGDKKFNENTDEAIIGSDGLTIMKTFSVAK